LQAGQEYTHSLGNGLRVWFQPIASGWILRLVLAAGPVGDHDYAELATPPYQSVSPLSISTDFAFRAQDAVGWNPRRFQFAASLEDFKRLRRMYERLEQANGHGSTALDRELAAEVGRAAQAKLTIVDARLVPGMADQWRMAAAVSSRFASTAHTLVEPADGRPSQLGTLVWVRFRMEFELPPGFRPDPGLRVVPQVCGDF
jgi:hypothetical protein